MRGPAKAGTATKVMTVIGIWEMVIPPFCLSAVKVLLVRRLLFAVFLPQNTANDLPYLLRFLYLVFQCEIAAGQFLPLGGQLLLLRFPCFQRNARPAVHHAVKIASCGFVMGQLHAVRFVKRLLLFRRLPPVFPVNLAVLQILFGV